MEVVGHGAAGVNPPPGLLASPPEVSQEELAAFARAENGLAVAAAVLWGTGAVALPSIGVTTTKSFWVFWGPEIAAEKTPAFLPNQSH
jgi:hypothetical protein